MAPDSSSNMDVGDPQQADPGPEPPTFSDQAHALHAQLLNRGPEVVQGLERILAHHPEVLDSPCKSALPTTEPIYHYITDIEIRLEIWRQFEHIAKATNRRLNAVALGVTMVAPIERLQQISRELKALKPRGSGWFTAAGCIDTLTADSCAAIRDYFPKGRIPKENSVPSTPVRASPTITPRKASLHRRVISTSSNLPASEEVDDKPSTASAAPSSPASSTGSSRDPKAATQCKYRDDHACVITKILEPEAAHIFPHATSARKRFQNLENMLSAFWGEEKSKYWMELIQNPTLMESTQNLICLERQMHWFFDTAKFGLKPLRHAEDHVVVQFHWLKDTGLKPKTDLMSGVDLAGITDQRWGPQRGMRRDDGWPVSTGQIYVISSTDPKNFPPPSFGLLQLQWDLIRVGAICGAAEADDDSGDDDDDDVSDYVYAGITDWESEVEDQDAEETSQ